MYTGGIDICLLKATSLEFESEICCHYNYRDAWPWWNFYVWEFHKL